MVATKKQKEFVKRLIISKTPTEAAMEVYQPTSRQIASEIASKNLKNPTIQKLMDKLGLGDESLLRAFTDALQAQKVLFIDRQPIEVPDHFIRIKASEIALKLKGYLGERLSTSSIPPEIKVQFIKVDNTKRTKKLLKSI